MTTNSQTSNPSQSPSPYTYLDAGFNRFFSRSLGANPANGNLMAMSNGAGSNMLNFDQMRTSGSLGDKIQVGGVIIDGTNRRIVIIDESGQEVGWVGNITNG